MPSGALQNQGHTIPHAALPPTYISQSERVEAGSSSEFEDPRDKWQISKISDMGERPQEAWLRPVPPPKFLRRLPQLWDRGEHCPMSNAPLLSFLLGQTLSLCMEGVEG